jgi:HSP20 family protein
MKAVARRDENGNAAAVSPERVEYVLPAVNIYETDDGYLLEADMPGVSREGLEIFLDQNELTLIGRRRGVSMPTTHYRESSEGDFRRVFELNPEIDTEKISARVENGVLTLSLAKREQVKPRRIKVTD